MQDFSRTHELLFAVLFQILVEASSSLKHKYQSFIHSSSWWIINEAHRSLPYSIKIDLFYILAYIKCKPMQTPWKLYGWPHQVSFPHHHFQDDLTGVLDSVMYDITIPYSYHNKKNTLLNVFTLFSDNYLFLLLTFNQFISSEVLS